MRFVKKKKKNSEWKLKFLIFGIDSKIVKIIFFYLKYIFNYLKLI